MFDTSARAVADHTTPDALRVDLDRKEHQRGSSECVEQVCEFAAGERCHRWDERTVCASSSSASLVDHVDVLDPPLKR